MYGFQNIVVGYRGYSQNTTEFVTEFSLREKDRRFTNISQPNITTPVVCLPFNDYTTKYELYFDEGLSENFGSLSTSSKLFKQNHFEKSRGPDADY